MNAQGKDSVAPNSRAEMSAELDQKISRRRRRDKNGDSRPTPMTGYQISFSCKHTGRYFRRSKRQISWLFGVINPSSETGKKYEKHRVDLVWSVKSGKTKLYWNDTDISHLFQKQQHRSDMVEFAWQTRAGHELHLVAHAKEASCEHQYDLILDGTSFSHLPTIDKLREESNHAADRISDAEESVEIEHVSDSGLGDVSFRPSADAGFRLSMVGLNGGISTDVQDELRSDLYTPIIESLRGQITQYLPQLEDMVSRAFTKAFLEDSDSSHNSCRSSSFASASSVSSGSLFEVHPFHVEADALWETYDWNKKKFCATEEQRLSFMEQHINAIFARVRNEELSAKEASRILVSVASLLGLEFANPIPRDTVVLAGLLTNKTANDLRETLSTYGDVGATAVASGRHGFGFCRFEDSTSVSLVQHAARKKELLVLGSNTTCIALTENMQDKQSYHLASRSDEKIDQPASPALCSAPDTPSIPHLLAPLDAGFEESYGSLTTPSHSPSAGKKFHGSVNSSTTASATDSDNDAAANGFSPNSVTSLLEPGPLCQDSSLYPTLPS